LGLTKVKFDYITNSSDQQLRLLRRLQFQAVDCKMPAGPTMFTSFLAKGQPLFVNSDLMRYSDYAHMLR